MEPARQDLVDLTGGGASDSAIAGALSGDEQGMLDLLLKQGVALARARRWDELFRTVETVDPPVTFFNNICVTLRWEGDYAVLGEMHRVLPDNHLITPLLHYYAGVEQIALRRYKEALDFFHNFSLLTLHNIELYRPMLTRRNYHLVFRQGTLVEPVGTMAGLDDGSVAVETRDPEITVVQRACAEEQGVVFACGLNDLYFHRFAESLTKTLIEACGTASLHFHVLGSQKDCLDLFRDLEARYPEASLGLSLDPKPIACHAPYYACDRFVVQPQLAALYERDIMILDADGLVRGDLHALHRRLRSESPAADFACFNTGRTEPASVYQATLTYFADTPACRRFVELVRRFIFSKLSRPPEVSWLTDQSSLFSVLTYLDHIKEPGFTFRPLDELTGGTLDDYVLSSGTDAEKRALVDAGYLR